MALSDEARLVLVSLAAGSKHPYAVGKDVQEFAGRTLGPGTLYGAIGRLQGGGYIAPLRAKGRRRPYQITPVGREALRQQVRQARRLALIAERRLAASG